MYAVETILKYRKIIKSVPYLLDPGSHLMKPYFHNVVIFTITFLFL